MITTSPTRARAARPQSAAWRLFAPGDEVSIAGTGTYEIVHLSHGRAWLEGRDGSQQLADASALELRIGRAAAASRN